MSSCEEGDDDHDKKEGTKKRSYECTFCKRGFTNAQALGGHMNIHRKDRAKANKQIPNSSSQISNQFFTNDETVTFPPFVSEQQPKRQNFDHNMYFQHHQYLPTSQNYFVTNQSPSINVHGFSYEYQRSSSTNWPNLHLSQEIQGTNLSLQIGSSHHYVDNSNTHHQMIRKGNNQEENEVDLELRLGHDP